jgi:hypothetical protein
MKLEQGLVCFRMCSIILTTIIQGSTLTVVRLPGASEMRLQASKYMIQMTQCLGKNRRNFQH